MRKRCLLLLFEMIISIMIMGCNDAIETVEAPTNLAVTESTTNITLSWEYESKEDIEFIVYRKLSDSDEDYIAITDNLPSNTRSFEDNYILCDTNYSYKVKSILISNREEAYTEAIEVFI